ncbi:MAG: ARPP-1 family domain-containing protein [Methanosarcinales archaeon]
MNKIFEYLDHITLGEPISFKNMTIFPVFNKNGTGFDYLTLDFALQNNLIEILEKDLGGSVPELKVFNKSNHHILLVDGEELIGAKQNRILNTTIIITPYSETIIPVSCVEQSRWSYKSKKFYTGKYSHARLRGAKAAQVSESLRFRGSYRSDQAKVWNEISRKSAVLHAHSPTSALYDVYGERERDLDQYLKAFSYIKGCNGLIVAINGEIACADIFDNPKTMEGLWKKLLNSYALDAIEYIREDTKVSIEHAKSFLNEVKKGEFLVYNEVRSEAIKNIFGNGDKIIQRSNINLTVG